MAAVRPIATARQHVVASHWRDRLTQNLDPTFLGDRLLVML